MAEFSHHLVGCLHTWPLIVNPNEASQSGGSMLTVRECEIQWEEYGISETVFVEVMVRVMVNEYHIQNETLIWIMYIHIKFSKGWAVWIPKSKKSYDCKVIRYFLLKFLPNFLVPWKMLVREDYDKDTFLHFYHSNFGCVQCSWKSLAWMVWSSLFVMHNEQNIKSSHYTGIVRY